MRRRYSKRITRNEQLAFDLFYGDVVYTAHERQLMAKRLGEAVTKRPEYPFIRGEELAEQSKFTITGARLMQTPRFGSQWYFDVAYKADYLDKESPVIRCCISLNTNRERDAIGQAVIASGAIVNCRMYLVATNAANRYAKIVDADEPEPESRTVVQDDIPGLTDDDVPF